MSLGVLVQALLADTASLCPKPPTFRPMRKKMRCKKKELANMLGCFNKIATCLRHPSMWPMPSNRLLQGGDFLCFSTTEVGWAVAAFGDLYKSIVKVLQIKRCQYKVNLWRLEPFFCQLFQAKDGKDAIVTGGPYALLRHLGHKFVLRFRFRWNSVKGMILIGT